MPKGGARVRSSVPPDPNALQRDRDAGEWVTLPAEGRLGDPPAWPLPKPTARERRLWAEHWCLPQAVQWERLGQQHLVGIYVRRLVEAEERGSPVAVSTLVRQLADSLGLTTPGMRSNRWRIEGTADAIGDRRERRAPSARSRLRVVGDALEGS